VVSAGTPVSSINKTDLYDITEILLRWRVTNILQPQLQLWNSTLIYTKEIHMIVVYTHHLTKYSPRIDYSRQNTLEPIPAALKVVIPHARVPRFGYHPADNFNVNCVEVKNVY